MKQFLSLFIICLTFSADAQYMLGYTSGYQSTGGIETNFDNELFTLAPKTGYNIGLALDIKLSNKWSIEPMLGYSKKGWNELNNFEEENIRNLHYLSTQLVIKYHLLDEYKFIGGPEISYLMTANSGLNNQAPIANYNPLDISFFFGHEITFWEIITVYAKYNFGLNSVSEEMINDNNGAFLGTVNIKNVAIIYGVSFYLFRSAKK